MRSKSRRSAKRWVNPSLRISTSSVCGPSWRPLFRATRKLRVLSRDQEVIADIREEAAVCPVGPGQGRRGATGELSNANYLILPKVQDFKFYRSGQAVTEF